MPGFEKAIDRPDLTAAAGPVLAVNRCRFLELGGYDPIYFPGRIEDLDLGFRAWMAGFRGYYVPESVAYHQGFSTFEPQLGKDRCSLLAIRNTLIFMWKNVGGARLLLHLAWLPVRLGWSLLRGQPGFARAFFEAVCAGEKFWRLAAPWRWGRGAGSQRQEAFFRRFRVVSERPRAHGVELSPAQGWVFSSTQGGVGMSARAFQLVIDARPRGPHGPLAAEVVLGRSVLDHLLELADELRSSQGSRSWSTRARTSTGRMRELAGRSVRRGRAVRERAAACRCGGAENRSSLRCADGSSARLRRGRSPETAVICGGSTGRKRLRLPTKS